MPSSIVIARPLPDEHSEEGKRYLDAVPGDDAWPWLESQVWEMDRLFLAMPEDRARHRYAAGKWSVQEVLGHLADCERVYAYRALRFARADATPLPGFDENLYVPAGRFDARPAGDVLDEWRTVRLATLALYRGFDAETLLRRGVANERPVSVRALAWGTAGHVEHHLGVLNDRYGVRGRAGG